MKKNDIFTFTAPNGVEVTAVVLDVVEEHSEDPEDGSFYDKYLCYAQNRLFYYEHLYGHAKKFIGYDEQGTYYDEKDLDEWNLEKVIVDYAVLPDYDRMLERYNDIEVAQAETASGM
jgi:hypothetical protein